MGDECTDAPKRLPMTIQPQCDTTKSLFGIQPESGLQSYAAEVEGSPVAMPAKPRQGFKCILFWLQPNVIAKDGATERQHSAFRKRGPRSASIPTDAERSKTTVVSEHGLKVRGAE